MEALLDFLIIVVILTALGLFVVCQVTHLRLLRVLCCPARRHQSLFHASLASVVSAAGRTSSGSRIGEHPPRTSSRARSRSRDARRDGGNDAAPSGVRLSTEHDVRWRNSNDGGIVGSSDIPRPGLSRNQGPSQDGDLASFGDVQGRARQQGAALDEQHRSEHIGSGEGHEDQLPNAGQHNDSFSTVASSNDRNQRPGSAGRLMEDRKRSKGIWATIKSAVGAVVAAVQRLTKRLESPFSTLVFFSETTSSSLSPAESNGAIVRFLKFYSLLPKGLVIMSISVWTLLLLVVTFTYVTSAVESFIITQQQQQETATPPPSVPAFAAHYAWSESDDSHRYSTNQQHQSEGISSKEGTTARSPSNNWWDSGDVGLIPSSAPNGSSAPAESGSIPITAMTPWNETNAPSDTGSIAYNSTAEPNSTTMPVSLPPTAAPPTQAPQPQSLTMPAECGHSCSTTCITFVFVAEGLAKPLILLLVWFMLRYRAGAILKAYYAAESAANGDKPRTGPRISTDARSSCDDSEGPNGVSPGPVAPAPRAVGSQGIMRLPLNSTNTDDVEVDRRMAPVGPNTGCRSSYSVIMDEEDDVGVHPAAASGATPPNSGGRLFGTQGRISSYIMRGVSRTSAYGDTHHDDLQMADRNSGRPRGPTVARSVLNDFDDGGEVVDGDAIPPFTYGGHRQHRSSQPRPSAGGCIDCTSGRITLQAYFRRLFFLRMAPLLVVFTIFLICSAVAYSNADGRRLEKAAPSDDYTDVTAEEIQSNTTTAQAFILVFRQTVVTPPSVEGRVCVVPILMQVFTILYTALFLGFFVFQAAAHHRTLCRADLQKHFRRKAAAIFVLLTLDCIFRLVLVVLQATWGAKVTAKTGRMETLAALTHVTHILDLTVFIVAWRAVDHA